MGEDGILVLISIAIIFLIIYRLFLSEKAAMKKLFQTVKEKPVSQFKDGDVVKVRGKVEYKGQTLAAPFSGRKCIQYHIIVKRVYSSAIDLPMSRPNPPEDEILLEDVKTADIVLNKDGQYIFVAGVRKKNTFLIFDEEYKDSLFSGLPDRVEKYMKGKSFPAPKFGYSSTTIYSEGVVEEGEMLTVIGKARWINAADTKKIPDLRKGKILEIYSDDEREVVLSDDPTVNYFP